MAQLNAATVAAKWARNMQGAGQSITDGVNAVTQAPGQAAAAQQAAWAAAVAASQQKWATNVAAVSVSDWKAAMINKGIPRIATGIQGGTQKMQAAMSVLLPRINSIVSSLPPRGPAGSNQQRMIQFSQQMHQAAQGG